MTGEALWRTPQLFYVTHEAVNSRMGRMKKEGKSCFQDKECGRVMSDYWKKMKAFGRALDNEPRNVSGWNVSRGERARSCAGNGIYL